jgi:hypothetical protein
MNMLQKIFNFLKSLFKHLRSGRPKSSQSLIDFRFDICSSCDKMDKYNNECIVCGCNINNKKIFMNKLAWADQKCPIGKW